MIKDIVSITCAALIINLISCYSCYSQEIEDNTPMNLVPSASNTDQDGKHHNEFSQLLKQRSSGDFYNTAVVNILDKKLGKMDVVNINIQNPVLYNDEIIVKTLACWKEKTPKLFPDSKALLEFYSACYSLEKVYLGWFFSKNPGISGFRTEKYEFILSDCINTN